MEGEPATDGTSHEKELAAELTLKAEATSSASLDLSVESPNAATARRLALEAAIVDVEHAVKRRSNHDAQLGTKRALEAVHELEDCRKRGEWTQTGWDANALGLWKGLIGVRNMAHHSSSGIVALHGTPRPDEQLKWRVSAAALADLRKERPAQAKEYSARLDGQPVLYSLREVRGRVQAAVPGP